MVNGKTKATDYLVGEAAARAGGFAANTSAALDVIKTLAQQYEIVIAIRTSKSFSAIKDPNRAPKSKDVQDKSSNWGPQEDYIPENQKVLGKLSSFKTVFETTSEINIQEAKQENKLSIPKNTQKRRNSMPLLRTPNYLHDRIAEKKFNILELREDGTMLFEADPKHRPRRTSAVFSAQIPENATLDQKIPFFMQKSQTKILIHCWLQQMKKTNPMVATLIYCGSQDHLLKNV